MTPVRFATISELEARVGERVAESGWLTVTQVMVDAFADLTGDRQWIHVDVERARRESPFGTTIAHGFLTLSLLSKFSAEALQMPSAKLSINYGFDRVRFISPVPVGAEVRAAFALASLERLGADVQIAWDVTVEVRGGTKPALAARWLSRAVAPADQARV